MQYNRARWYDPATGRWLSTDPIGFGGGDVNLYRMFGNHPTSATDPSGLEEGEELLKELQNLRKIIEERQHTKNASKSKEGKHTDGLTRQLDDGARRLERDKATAMENNRDKIAYEKSKPMKVRCSEELERMREMYRDELADLDDKLLKTDVSKRTNELLDDRNDVEAVLKHLDELEKLVQAGKFATVAAIIQKGKWAAKLAGKILIPLAVFGYASAASRGYAGEGRLPEPGYVAGGVEVAAEFMCADELEKFALKPAANWWTNWLSGVFNLNGTTSDKQQQIQDAINGIDRR